MELELIRLVQSAASPALDQIFLFFTLLGEAWLPVLLVAGFWLPVCGALVILFPVLDKAFGLREADRAAAQPAEGGV